MEDSISSSRSHGNKGLPPLLGAAGAAARNAARGIIVHRQLRCTTILTEWMGRRFLSTRALSRCCRKESPSLMHFPSQCSSGSLLPSVERLVCIQLSFQLAAKERLFVWWGTPLLAFVRVATAFLCNIFTALATLPWTGEESKWVHEKGLDNLKCYLPRMLLSCYTQLPIGVSCAGTFLIDEELSDNVACTM